MSFKDLSKEIIRKQDCEAFLCIISSQGADENNNCHEDLNSLMKKHTHLFEVPKDLPPKRMMDHRILIKLDILPIKQHAYRYHLL